MTDAQLQRALQTKAFEQAANLPNVPQRSRRRRQCELDAWLLIHTVRLVTEPAADIARELQRLGHFSAKTGLGDIRLSFQARCRKLGIPFNR